MIETTRSLNGRTILLVEDDYFIAQDMARTLNTDGVDVIGPVASVEAAMKLIDRTEQIDGAVLDINLQGTLSWPIAEAFLERGVRFVFATGYDSSVIPSRYAEIVPLQKPVTYNNILTGLLA